MIKKTLATAAVSSALLLVTITGCVDNDYDLSDIDTTSRFTVKDLVIPMNLDAITLDNVIDIDPDSKIQIYTDDDGHKYYAIHESGNFSSNPIDLGVIRCNAPTVESKTIHIHSIPGIEPYASIGTISMSYKIDPTQTRFEYDITGIDEAVHSITSIQVQPMQFRISLQAPGLNGTISSVEFSNLEIILPKGLKATSSTGTYNSETGSLLIEHLESNGASAEIVLTATAIDLNANGATIDYNTHSMLFKGQIEVKSGTLKLNSNGVAALPSSIDFTTSYTLSAIEATAFSGDIEYNITGVNINDVDLSDIPDFLAGEETNLSIVNPQLYITVNNPVGPASLDCTTGLTLTAKRNGVANQSYSLDEQSSITIGHNNGYGPYSFCLSPVNPTKPLINGSEHVGFSDLSNVLSGEGIPNSLGVELDSPRIPLQHAINFKLEQIPGVDGSYEFFAPLALTDGSKIVYTSTENGWNDDDIDAITIEKIKVTATATSTIPLEATLNATVLDKFGNPLPAKLSSVTIPASASDYQFTIELSEGQTVTHLDGITFTATVIAKGGKEIAPEQNITLKNIRATVSGYYEKEL